MKFEVPRFGTNIIKIKQNKNNIAKANKIRTGKNVAKGAQSQFFGTSEPRQGLPSRLSDYIYVLARWMNKSAKPAS